MLMGSICPWKFDSSSLRPVPLLARSTKLVGWSSLAMSHWHTRPSSLAEISEFEFLLPIRSIAVTVDLWPMFDTADFATGSFELRRSNSPTIPDSKPAMIVSLASGWNFTV